jgi:serine/threonine-protein kinase
VDGRLWKGERTKVDGLSPGEEHAIVLAANGYSPRTLKVTAQAGETKSFSVVLAKIELPGGHDGGRPPIPPSPAGQIGGYPPSSAASERSRQRVLDDPFR